MLLLLPLFPYFPSTSPSPVDIGTPILTWCNLSTILTIDYASIWRWWVGMIHTISSISSILVSISISSSIVSLYPTSGPSPPLRWRRSHDDYFSLERKIIIQSQLF